MLQQLTYEGRLGGDPELRYTPAGKSVVNFNMASDTVWYGEDGTKHKDTTWLRVTVWGKGGENVNKFLHKGSHVVVEGALKADENGRPKIFTNTTTGVPSASYDVTATKVHFMDSASAGQGKDADTGFTGAPEEDIPF